MRLVLLLLVLFPLTGQDLIANRILLAQSVEDEKAADRLYAQFKAVKDDAEPVLVGFKAMSEFMRCKHLFNPITRIGHFNKGKKLLEAAIQRDHLNPELLYFRFSTQSNIPALLKYKMNIEGDKRNLISYLKTGNHKSDQDHDLYLRIKAYLLVNEYCSAEEKAMIKTL